MYNRKFSIDRFFNSIGDYGRGGVEAIRRLLNKDACIGADFTMVIFTLDGS